MLSDGREIDAHLENEPETIDIRLPKRKEGSFIAESWLKEDLANKPHDADDETEPVGDGDAGDGLTLYEEYRGFYAGGTSPDKHVSGDPKTKDLFVVNRIGEHDGFATFAAATKLRLVTRITTNEMGNDRVVNFNRSGSAPHRVEQHAVIIQRAAVSGGIGEASGGPGLPKHVNYIAISHNYNLGQTPGFVRRDGRGRSTDYTAATVAHELGHSCNIYHHGEQEIKGVDWVAARVDEALVWQENGATIAALHDPSGLPFLPRSEGEAIYSMTMGVKGGLGSGSEDCFMRYENHAHIWSGGGPVRYYITADKDELAGTSLCESKTGTGVNAAKPGTPWPRFGDATAGSCAGQICVNDAMSHPAKTPP